MKTIQLIILILGLACILTLVYIVVTKDSVPAVEGEAVATVQNEPPREDIDSTETKQELPVISVKKAQPATIAHNIEVAQTEQPPRGVDNAVKTVEKTVVDSAVVTTPTGEPIKSYGGVVFPNTGKTTVETVSINRSEENKSHVVSDKEPAFKTPDSISRISVSPDGFEKFPECRLYMTSGNLKENFEKISSMTSLVAMYDSNSAKFELKKPEHIQNIPYNMVLWEGFFNIRKSGTYTFFVQWYRDLNYDSSHGCVLSINDKLVMTTGEATLDVELKAGINKMRFCCYHESGLNDYRSASPQIRYKLRNAIGDYRDFRPAELFHKTVEEDW